MPLPQLCGACAAASAMCEAKGLSRTSLIWLGYQARTSLVAYLGAHHNDGVGPDQLPHIAEEAARGVQKVHEKHHHSLAGAHAGQLSPELVWGQQVLLGVVWGATEALHAWDHVAVAEAAAPPANAVWNSDHEECQAGARMSHRLQGACLQQALICMLECMVAR